MKRREEAEVIGEILILPLLLLYYYSLSTPSIKQHLNTFQKAEIKKN